MYLDDPKKKMGISSWTKIEATGARHKLKQQGRVEQEVVKNKNFPDKEKKQQLLGIEYGRIGWLWTLLIQGKGETKMDDYLWHRCKR